MQLAAISTVAVSEIVQAFDRNAVVEQYAYLIKKVAYRMISRLPANVEMDDLMSSGVLGLIDAADKYDSEKSCNFKSYAEIRIRGAMVDDLRAVDWVPRSVRQKSASIEHVSRELAGKLGRAATDVEIAAELGLSLEELRVLTDKARAVSVVSYEDLGVGAAEDKRDFLDGVSDPEALDPEQTTEQSDERAATQFSTSAHKSAGSGSSTPATGATPQCQRNFRTTHPSSRPCSAWRRAT